MARLTTCRDCGATVSKKAATCPQCGRPLSKPAKQYGCFSGCLILGLVGLVALFGFSLFNGGRDRQAVNPDLKPDLKSPSSSEPSPRGDVAKVEEAWTRLDTGYISDQLLTYQGTPVVCLCVDEKVWNEMFDDLNKSDMQEIALLVAKGKIALVPLGTRVKCVETGFTSLKLHVSEGPSAGVEGWLEKEFVSKGEPPSPGHVDDSQPPAKKSQRTLQPQPLKPEQMARARFQIGSNLEKDGKDELAVTAYKDVVKQFPDTPQAKQAAERIKALTGK